MVAALLAATTLPVRGAWAEDAEVIYRLALTRFARADFARSAKLLERAAGLAVDPKLLGRIRLQLGVCHEVMGKVEDARAAFRAALEQDPELALEASRHRTSARALFDSVREGLRGELVVSCEGGPGTASLDGAALGAVPLTRPVGVGAHRLEIAGHDGAIVWSRGLVVGVGKVVTVNATCPIPPARVSVVSEPPGAEVIIDGAQVGATPCTASLRPGRHRLLLRRSGFLDRTLALELPAGARRALELRLDPLPPPPSPALPSAPPPARRRVWTWVVGATAVASLGAALGAGLASRADHSAWEAEWERGTDPVRYEELRSSGQQKQLAANVLAGVGAALAVGAVVLYFLEGRASREARRLHSRGAAPGVSF